ncbi:uncharacterized protein EV154DRAFT_527242 [Mucor mucedo]|uniref:uncharacterized protein n=1 Tax=Mucor mucedo TaxID=29922 RepID=UPI00221F5F02|nr:uncharacterized protein EV154DRAFT_527242 [Mucor mucedo]KAI7874346.1 hypothetical protein EV154DRAFT_527242 [Mucor mucedo]
MVSLKTFLTSSVALIAAFITVEAAVSPSYPSPGTIQTEGQTYEITWTFDGKNPSTTYQIDFMTGSNDVQTVLSTVATKVDPALLKYTFVAPQVTPHSAVYFFMFTGSDKVSAWTTRFAIVGADGQLVAEKEKVQPNGDKIPWGIGALATATSGNTTAASASASSSAIATPAANSTETVIPAANAAAAAAVSSSPVVEEAANASPVSSPVPTVAQVAAASTPAISAGSMVKPALTLVSAAVAGYFVL